MGLLRQADGTDTNNSSFELGWSRVEELIPALDQFAADHLLGMVLKPWCTAGLEYERILPVPFAEVGRKGICFQNELEDKEDQINVYTHTQSFLAQCFQWPHVWRVVCIAPDLLEYSQWLSTVLDRAHCHSLAICVQRNITYNAEDFVTFIGWKLFVLMLTGNLFSWLLVLLAPWLKIIKGSPRVEVIAEIKMKRQSVQGLTFLVQEGEVDPLSVQMEVAQRSFGYYIKPTNESPMVGLINSKKKKDGKLLVSHMTNVKLSSPQKNVTEHIQETLEMFIKAVTKTLADPPGSVHVKEINGELGFKELPPIKDLRA
ncbi:hypothetical protein AAES_19655 [Amazona aestiva]|uniref:Uncharacterized protein n=1 Tax=Amazona aestiva TaxID=12930 RepID=A0A0Q3X4Q4_AMAAE|nr:hypothetical protein AAES_19655 [Amazona aestiva]